MLALVLALAALQAGVSLAVRTERASRFLTRQLEGAFGRKVEVRQYSASLFPTPQIDADGISVGEDPSFGQEYFLRAERLSAGLRWMGVLRGKFELGTLRLERPSLVLVRNQDGRWNLERWLPAMNPAAGSESPQALAARAAASPTAHRLQKIDISDGRVDFKLGDDKISFAFIQVQGDVEQVADDRWRLDLESEPWRSGVPLQLAGTVRLRGDVAGTSTRLQPAHLQVSWEKSSLADVFRLLGGRDFGVRGTFAGEATAESGAPYASADSKRRAPGDWSFSIDARAGGIHRWDLTERQDNPSISLRAKGIWNPGLGTTTAQEVVLEAPGSNLRGSAFLKSVSDSLFEIRLDSAGIQAKDLLAWYRAFQPGVAETVAADQYFTGSATLRGWPLEVEEAAFSSTGGRWAVPGLSAPVTLKPVRGGMQRGRLILEPFVVSVPQPVEVARNAAAAREAALTSSGAVNVSLNEDFRQRAGALRFEGQLPHSESLFALASAFGHSLQHGWELQGKAAGDLRWEWGGGKPGSWNGRADLTHATLQVAGLNQPVLLETVRAEWRYPEWKINVGKVLAFGTTWGGSLDRNALRAGADDNGDHPQWTFQLQADRLSAAELDRWIGPRSRPNWLQRLLPSALGGSSPSAVSAAVLKELRAEGTLQVDEFALEKINLKNVRSRVRMEGLQLTVEDAQAQWCGGTVQGRMTVAFSDGPTYEVAADFARVSVTQTPWLAQAAEHLAGTADGSLKLRAKGIGREALLASLNGKGEVRLSKVELRGWDLPGTMALGEWKTGISRWASGSGTFHISEGGFDVNSLRLASSSDEFLLKGSVSFAQDADLIAESRATGRAAHAQSAARFLTISGPLSEPRVSLEKALAQQPGD